MGETPRDPCMWSLGPFRSCIHARCGAVAPGTSKQSECPSPGCTKGCCSAGHTLSPLCRCHDPLSEVARLQVPAASDAPAYRKRRLGGAARGAHSRAATCSLVAATRHGCTCFWFGFVGAVYVIPCDCNQTRRLSVRPPSAPLQSEGGEELLSADQPREKRRRFKHARDGPIHGAGDHAMAVLDGSVTATGRGSADDGGDR